MESNRQSPLQMPSPQTTFRALLLSRESEERAEQAIVRARPLLWLRDRERVGRVKNAATLPELLAVAEHATGLAEPLWRNKVRAHDDGELLAELTRALPALQGVLPEPQRPAAQRLLGELRWLGPPGAGLLLGIFDSLDPYACSLACVALGLAPAPQAADALHRFYRSRVDDLDSSDFVGALWGLCDLGDAHVPRILSELLARGHVFYELFAMLSMRGDGAAVPVLAELMPELDEQEQRGALVALAAIGRRLGAADLGRILGDDEDAAGEGGQLAAELLRKPIPAPEDYFSLVYSGFA